MIELITLTRPSKGGFSGGKNLDLPNRSHRISSAIVSIIVFVFLLFCLDKYLVEQPSIYKRKQQLCFGKSKQATVLILGSSHALFGIRPDYLSEQAINLSNVSQSLDLDQKLLAKALKQNHKCKLVIIPVSYFSLEESLTSTAEEWRDCLYSRYLGVSERSLWQICFDPRYWSLPFLYRSYLLPWQKLRDDYTLASYRVDDFGWAANKNLLDGRKAEAIGLARVKLFESFMKPQTLQYHEKILQRIIDFCRQRRVKVLLVTMPCWGTFRKFAAGDKITQTQTFMSALVFPNQIAYADYWDDSRFALSDFADTDHLNSTGAAKFSHLLDCEFVKPFLNSQ